MSLIGRIHLVYLPTPILREVLLPFGDPDDYGAIYEVMGTTHPPRLDPPRVDLDAAHWTMFLALTEKFEGVKTFSEEHGFDACWTVHRLEIELGEVAVKEARSLKANTN